MTDYFGEGEELVLERLAKDDEDAPDNFDGKHRL